MLAARSDLIDRQTEILAGGVAGSEPVASVALTVRALAALHAADEAIRRFGSANGAKVGELSGDHGATMYHSSLTGGQPPWAAAHADDSIGVQLSSVALNTLGRDVLAGKAGGTKSLRLGAPLDAIRLEVDLLDTARVTGKPDLAPPLAVYNDGTVEEMDPPYRCVLSTAPGTALRSQIRQVLAAADTSPVDMLVVLHGLLPKGHKSGENVELGEGVLDLRKLMRDEEPSALSVGQSIDFEGTVQLELIDEGYKSAELPSIGTVRTVVSGARAALRRIMAEARGTVVSMTAHILALRDVRSLDSLVDSIQVGLSFAGAREVLSPSMPLDDDKNSYSLEWRCTSCRSSTSLQSISPPAYRAPPLRRGTT